MGMRVVFTAAIMDLCHKGHLNLLKEMRKHGDYSIVVLHDDISCFKIKGKIPVQNIKQRVKNLKITGLVDKVLVTKSIDPADQFAKIFFRYNNVVFVRGDDNLTPPAKWFLDKHKIEQIYIPYTEGVNSTKIKKELCNL